MFCSKCGKELSSDARFCRHCGQATSFANAQSAQAPGAPVVAPAPVRTPEPVPAGRSGKGRSSRTPLIAASVAAVVLVGAVFAVGTMTNAFPWAQGPSSAPAGQSDTSVVSHNGQTVTSLTRPSLVTVQAVPGTQTMGSPALLNYISASASATASSSASASSTANVRASQPIVAAGQSQSGNLKLDNVSGTVDMPTPAAGLSNVANADAFEYELKISSLASELEQNLFVVDEGTDREYFDLYEKNRYETQASFITTDSVLHTYHLYFQHLLKNAERDALSAELLSSCTAMMNASIDQLNTLQGTEWEAAAQRNVVFFAVPCLLLGADVNVPGSVSDQVSSEYQKVMAASGIDECSFMAPAEYPNQTEDYSQYKPRGYYEGDAKLESYFRAMMWCGRMHFLQSDESLDRSALLMTLALDGQSKGTPNQEWAHVYTVTSFFAGASDDNGYYEYLPIIQSAYGQDVTVASLAGNTKAWESYHALTAQMQPPAINSVPLGHERASQTELSDMAGFRFMGQRFTLDESIFTQLVYPNVERNMPSALDLPAALGSNEAVAALSEQGKTSYTGYSESMEKVRASLADTGSDTWSGSLYSQWLYTLNPLLTSKGEGYPAFMQSSAWDRKNLQSYLGSYTELKHDTVLYTKQVMAEMGGGVFNYDDRGYVEPEPELYARLSQLAQSTSDGLAGYGMLGQEDKDNLALLVQICNQLQAIAQKELSGSQVTAEEYDFIRDYGGNLEHFWMAVNPGVRECSNKSNYSPAAVVVDVATDGENGTCLELGTGAIDAIYVLVPIDGQLHLCKGGVYSYYEFEQPISNRLTDSEWRDMMGVSVTSFTKQPSAPARPEWMWGLLAAKG